MRGRPIRKLRARAAKAILHIIETRRRRLIALAVLSAAMVLTITVVLWTQPGLRRVGTIASLLSEQASSDLPVPVDGVAARDLVDTWGAPRSGNRRHEGIDIFAPRGCPVRSVTRGVVFKVGENNLGGHVVEVLGPGGCWHYYAHLDRFADIEPGDVVQKGTVLGYVGDTGNAKGTPYHLHYGIYGFWGSAENPYPLLAGNTKDADKPSDKPVTAEKTRKPAGKSRTDADGKARKRSHDLVSQLRRVS
ncbi:MAG TPA: M23 family metallopeptidase [Blastocatellia bacterium]|nr:M23 family metallopeptidase [Blastocatellia bacterium]